MNILHIAAHLGGGAGKAISGIAIQGQSLFPDTHRILLLQEPEKVGYVRECKANHVEVSVWQGEAFLQWADVVVINWWNHPAMVQFLHDLPPVSVPMLLWCHVNGCHYPMLPYPFADAFDKVLFTSPYSAENPSWSKAERQEIRKKSEIVYGMGQFAPSGISPKVNYQNQAEFTIGYAGTLNYGKIHPEFVAYCKEACARIPNARFVMAGDRNAALERDFQSAGLAERVTFAGFVSDVTAVMRTFDVFGYLLNPEHYGTTENVLLEAMACGLPVAAARQNAEQLVVPADAGYLVEDARQYGQLMEFLYQNPGEREKTGRRARAHVLARYHAEKNTARFREACRQLAQAPARTHDFSFLGGSPWEWFLYFLDEENKKRFETAWALLKAPHSAEQTQAARELIQTCPPVLREERKGSLRQFAAVFPQSQPLQILKKQMEQECYHGGN